MYRIDIIRIGFIQSGISFCFFVLTAEKRASGEGTTMKMPPEKKPSVTGSFCRQKALSRTGRQLNVFPVRKPTG
jgi:hypothetical protein